MFVKGLGKPVRSDRASKCEQEEDYELKNEKNQARFIMRLWHILERAPFCISSPPPLSVSISLLPPQPG